MYLLVANSPTQHPVVWCLIRLRAASSASFNFCFEFLLLYDLVVIVLLLDGTIKDVEVILTPEEGAACEELLFIIILVVCCLSFLLGEILFLELDLTNAVVLVPVTLVRVQDNGILDDDDDDDTASISSSNRLVVCVLLRLLFVLLFRQGKSRRCIL
jgi:hypothetical protein